LSLNSLKLKQQLAVLKRTDFIAIQNYNNSQKTPSKGTMERNKKKTN
jgi:hypothetical protein